MEITIKLHPAGHECAPGGMDCGVFSASFFGIRTTDNALITFATGSGRYTGAMIYVDGVVSEEEFRLAGTYKVAMLNRQPPCLHKEALKTTLYYQFTEIDCGLMPLTDTELPSGEVVYIDMQDALNPR